MDDSSDLIPTPAWATAESIDRAWTVAAVWLFSFSALVGTYMSLTGIASGDLLGSLAAVPTAVLVVAAAVVDARRRWSLWLGSWAGGCAAMVWFAALAEIPASDLGTALAVVGFAAGSLACARAFDAVRRGPSATVETSGPLPRDGWIEELR